MLNFPNPSRIFDPTRPAVRFRGHDSAMEWSFFVTEEALRLLQPKTQRDEVGLLLAFDTHLTAIYAAAKKAYDQGRKDHMNSGRRILPKAPLHVVIIHNPAFSLIGAADGRFEG